MAVAAADAPVRAIQDHASLLHMTTTREGAIRKDGLNLWINALYGAEHARNLGAGSLNGGYNADFGGIVFGGDYAFGDFRVGMAERRKRTAVPVGISTRPRMISISGA